MLILTLLTACFFAAAVWVRRGKKRAAAALAAAPAVPLPADDLPPASAVGWPPGGRQFTTYVDGGFAALDAYLAEGFAA
jgi:hypothetical protein